MVFIPLINDFIPTNTKLNLKMYMQKKNSVFDIKSFLNKLN